MPTESEHKSAFDRHLTSYRDTVEKHPDWAAVMLFYCAVHAAERLFAAADELHREHSTREQAIRSRFPSFWHPYRVLKSESLKTRYLEGGHFSLSASKVQSKLHDQHLNGIIRDVDARIAARRVL